MKRRFIIKNIQHRKPSTKFFKKIDKLFEQVEEIKVEDVTVVEEIKEEKEDIIVMDTKTKIELASAVLDTDEAVKVKKIKKDKGLIERTESSKTVLTEDNRELLIG